MNRARSHWLPMLILATAFVLPSCASGPPPGPDPADPADPAELIGKSAKTILVAPFNVVSSLPPDLEGSTRMVSNALVEHLEAHGKKVSVIGFRAGRDLWRAATKEVRTSGEKQNFENASRVYARMIGEQVEFDALIIPSLFVQNAKMRGRTVSWDGAKQPMVISGGTGSNKANTYGGNIGTISVRAASIFIHILDRDGVSVHTERSGLEIIQHLQFVVERKGGQSGSEKLTQILVNDSPPIEDLEMVRAGVAAVLSPFVSEEVPEPTSPSTSPSTPPTSPETETVPKETSGVDPS